MGCKSNKPKQNEKALKIRPQEKEIKKTFQERQHSVLNVDIINIRKL